MENLQKYNDIFNDMRYVCNSILQQHLLLLREYKNTDMFDDLENKQDIDKFIISLSDEAEKTSKDMDVFINHLLKNTIKKCPKDNIFVEIWYGDAYDEGEYNGLVAHLTKLQGDLEKCNLEYIQQKFLTE